MQAKRLPARHGMLWLLASFRLFRMNPPLITALAVGYLLVAITLNLIPVVGPILVPLALPTLMVVVANGCRAIEAGHSGAGINLLHGIQNQRVALVRLGGLNLLGSIFILVGVLLITGGSGSPLSAGQPLDQEETFSFLLQVLLVALPVASAFWFAPLLTAWDGVPPLKSVFFSFVASWRNWRAFAAFGVSILVVAIAVPNLLILAVAAFSTTLAGALSVIVKMALILVMLPVMMAGMFISYRDVFHGPAAAEADAEPQQS